MVNDLQYRYAADNSGHFWTQNTSVNIGNAWFDRNQLNTCKIKESNAIVHENEPR